jgi:hypothetical protein
MAPVPQPLILRASARTFWALARTAHHRRERRMWLQQWCKVKQQMRELV